MTNIKMQIIRNFDLLTEFDGSIYEEKEPQYFMFQPYNFRKKSLRLARKNKEKQVN